MRHPLEMAMKIFANLTAGAEPVLSPKNAARTAALPRFSPLLCGFAPLRLCAKSFAMAVESFKEFVLDQLRALPDVRAKAMFGAHGLYQDEHFFGILDEGRLFFKTDAQLQADYVARGMEPFSYESKGKVMTMAYHEVPPDVLENAPELVAWALRAIELARSRKSQKSSRRKKES
jgi:DNA transformation protein